MTTFQKTFIPTLIAVIAGAGIYEERQVAELKDQIQTLQQEQAALAEQLQQLARVHQDATNRLASLTDELARAKGDDLELRQLRNEITALKRSQAAATRQPNPLSSPSDPAGSGAAAPENPGKVLGQAIIRGDAGAFDKLSAEAKAEYHSFNTMEAGLTDQQKDEASRRTFSPSREAFKIIGDAAAHGSQPALDALTRALQLPELNGLAVHSLGGLAGNGDPGALEVLLHPEKYGVLLSGTISALQSAADNGNQKAIERLSVIANDQTSQPLWFMTANSLAKAAADGNSMAIDALINLSSSTDQNVRSAVVQALKGAAANQNAKAVEALRAIGVQ